MQPQFAIIATPSYQGDIQDLCVGSLLRAQRECIQAGIWVEWMPLSGSPYVEALRNMLVREFLNVPVATDLVFLDSDVGFEPGALVRLLQYDADVVGGMYPYKSDAGGFPGVLEQDAAGMPVPVEVGLLDGTGKPLLGPDGQPQRQQLAQAIMLPTGFLRIRRNVFERFREHYSPNGELEVVERQRDGAETGRYINYFETRQIGDLWFGEDVWFCWQWRKMGGTVLLDPDIHFSHSGRKHWKGNYHQHRARQAGGALQDTDTPEGWQTRAREAEQKLTRLGAALGSAAGRAQQILHPLDGIASNMTEAEAEHVLARHGATTGAAAGGEAAEAADKPGNGSEATAFTHEPGPELLLGCGASRFKVLVPPGGQPEWHALTTLDINADHAPDVVFDLGPIRLMDFGDVLPRLPFPDDHFAEIHAYEVLEHIGAQGDWRALLGQFAEFWRVLRPGGYLLGDVPAWDSEAAFADPSHSRVLPPNLFAYLSQAEYRRQIGVTMMADFRRWYRADFQVVSLSMDPAQWAIDTITQKAIRQADPPSGRFTRFVLRAVKPSTWSEADLQLVQQHRERRQGEYAEKARQWHKRQEVRP